MSRRFGSDEDEMAEAMRRHAADDAKAWREDRAAGEKMWQENERQRSAKLHVIPKGPWTFFPLFDTVGRVTGWKVELAQKGVGMIVIVRGDLHVFSSANDDLSDDPTPTDIMAAFTRLYPRGAADYPGYAQSQLPSGSRHALPEGSSPFGPSRNWDDE